MTNYKIIQPNNGDLLFDYLLSRHNKLPLLYNLNNAPCHLQLGAKKVHFQN